MRANDVGSLFEASLERVFSSLSNSHLFFWHKLADTGSTAGARAALGKQPSDYLIGFAGHAALCEAKSSTKHDTMSKELMQGSQRNAINRWAFANDLPYYVIFWSINTKTLQVWDGRAVPYSGRGLNPKGLLLEVKVGGKTPMSLDEDVVKTAVMDVLNIKATRLKALADNRKSWGVE